MSLTKALHAAHSGLQVSSLRANTVAENVANASTPGFVRRSVSLSEALVGSETNGVKTTGIRREQNEVLTASRREAASGFARADTLRKTWAALEKQLGAADGSSGLFARMANLEFNLSDFVSVPESLQQRDAVVDAANQLTGEFNRLHAHVQEQRGLIDGEIATAVDTVNAALKQIEILNEKISRAKEFSPQRAALQDDRDRQIDTVSEFLTVETVQRPGGALDLITEQGVFLIAGEARTLEFTPARRIDSDTTVANGLLSGLSIEGVDLTPGTATYSAISNGRLSALFSARDSELPRFADQLDALASDLVSRFADPSVDPTLSAGQQGLFVAPGSGTTGIAGRISVNAAVDPSQGGVTWKLRDGIGAQQEGAASDASLARRLVSALTSKSSFSTPGLNGSLSASEAMASFASETGRSRFRMEAVLTSASTQLDSLSQAESSENGVDMDRQMQELLLVEQAYSANARVVEVVDSLVRRLMEI